MPNMMLVLPKLTNDERKFLATVMGYYHPRYHRIGSMVSYTHEELMLSPLEQAMKALNWWAVPNFPDPERELTEALIKKLKVAHAEYVAGLAEIKSRRDRILKNRMR